MIEIHHIVTGLGKSIHRLPFLNEEQQKEFNVIGYTGMLYGKKTTREEYLNSLGLGEFKVEKTGFDGGNFIEEYIIVRVP